MLKVGCRKQVSLGELREKRTRHEQWRISAPACVAAAKQRGLDCHSEPLFSEQAEKGAGIWPIREL